MSVENFLSEFGLVKYFEHVAPQNCFRQTEPYVFNDVVYGRFARLKQNRHDSIFLIFEFMNDSISSRLYLIRDRVIFYFRFSFGREKGVSVLRFSVFSIILKTLFSSLVYSQIIFSINIDTSEIPGLKSPNFYLRRSRIEKQKSIFT